jgi:cell division protein FtsW (lipid II flippase)
LQNNVVLLAIVLVAYRVQLFIYNKNSMLCFCVLIVNMLLICTSFVGFVIIHRNNWSRFVKGSILVNNR